MKRVSIIFLVGLMQFLCVRLYAQSPIPYSIKGDVVSLAGQSNGRHAFSGSFTNKSEKNVSSFTFVFYVFDQDGNSPLIKQNNVVCKIDEIIPSKSVCNINVNLDEYFAASDEVDSQEDIFYATEYLYVSIISYEDGTEWKDPFGMEMF